MQLKLIRSYGAQGVNGVLYLNDQQVCYTIELPWQNNQRYISCIPEGSYPVVKRYSQRFGWHLHVQQVPGRSWILIHPANHAIKELQGCIAPVTELTGEGRGNASQRAMQHLMNLVNKAIEEQPTLLLTISAVAGTYTNTNHERGD
ncbi:DUF5675 family protein [Nostoc sp. NIES-2111]